MPGIFISYRRSDSAGHTGRLADDLSKHLDGQALFRDIEAIEAGVDFVQALERAVCACSVMLVIIGPTFASAVSSDGQRRLFQTGDFVRMEIEAALARDIRVIPVLVGDAQMPGATDLPDSMAALLRRNAYSISDRRWQYDVSQLVDILVKLPGVAARKGADVPPVARVQTKAPMSGWLKAVLGASGLLIVAVAALLLVPLDDKDSSESADTQAPTETRTPVLQLTVPATATAPEPASSEFYDNWVSASGEAFNSDTEEDTGRLYVFAGSRMDDGTGGGANTPAPDQPGQEIYGNGSINGRQLKATLTDAVSLENHLLQLELSADGTNLTGTISKGGKGLTRQLELTRKAH